ncbi:MAG: T9SS type A sorting domain-containing protein, partial [Bacteroidetes bacterium]|nr:T9SS type A sorting domain-containing protein [Bacteroidota bacterium]
AIKMNWMKKHGAIAPKYNDAFAPATFDMSQNYPNPFNPTTTIEYSVPERSRVHLRIVDMLGREVDVAVDDMVETGVYHYTFDAGALPSGQYIATVTMVGEESGLSFSKTIKMLLNK